MKSKTHRVGMAVVLTAAAVLAACGPGARDFEAGDVQTLVKFHGDQLHPHMDGNWLVWFDLEDDPNGRCFLPSYSPDGDYDRTCQGVIRSMNLVTGQVRTLSGTLEEEVRPVVSGGLVVWRCRGEDGYGLCVTPPHRRQVSFLPGVGWSRYWYEQGTRPWVANKTAIWVEYEYYPNATVFRLKKADLETGAIEEIQRMDQYPPEMFFFSNRLTWTENRWEQDGYHGKVHLMDIQTGARTLVVDREMPAYGLGGHGELMAFKSGEPIFEEETDPDLGVHIHYRVSGGEVFRADSDQARVSQETPISVGDDLLVWLDHREGAYRVAAYDLRGGQEAIVSPPEAVIGAYMPPAVGSDYIVWPDARNGDFDLVLFRF